MTLEKDPAAFWNGPAAERWVRLEQALDPMVGPFGDAAMEAAAIRPGERIADIGCGCGATTLELARRTGPGGRVVGADVSEPMLAVLRSRVARAGLTHVDVLLGDAAAASFPVPLDLLYSRFGWMFFPDPVAAFTHLRGAMAPGGRLALATWRAFDENEWAKIPRDAIVPLVGPRNASTDVLPGPFAFGDARRIEAVLGAAGWTGVTITPFDREVPLGGSGGFDGAVEHALEMGPAARALLDAGVAERPELRERARDAIRAALASHRGHDGAVRLHGAGWIVCAT